MHAIAAALLAAALALYVAGLRGLWRRGVRIPAIFSDPLFAWALHAVSVWAVLGREARGNPARGAGAYLYIQSGITRQGHGTCSRLR